VTFGHRKSAGNRPAGNEDILMKLTQMHLKEEQIMNCRLNDSKVKWQLWILGKLRAREEKMGRNRVMKTIWVDFTKKGVSFKAATLNNSRTFS
jgi:hypothetical protein